MSIEEWSIFSTHLQAALLLSAMFQYEAKIMIPPALVFGYYQPYEVSVAKFKLAFAKQGAGSPIGIGNQAGDVEREVGNGG